MDGTCHDGFAVPEPILFDGWSTRPHAVSCSNIPATFAVDRCDHAEWSITCPDPTTYAGKIHCATPDCTTIEGAEHVSDPNESTRHGAAVISRSLCVKRCWARPAHRHGFNAVPAPLGLDPIPGLESRGSGPFAMSWPRQPQRVSTNGIKAGVQWLCYWSGLIRDLYG
jgi:hypothetical protein